MKSSVFVVFANVLFALSQFLTLLIVNKLGSAVQVGILAYGLALVNPIFMLAQGGLRSKIIIDSEYEFNFKFYFFLRVVLIGIGIGVVVVYSQYVNKYFSELLALALVKSLDLLFDISHGEYQRAGNIRYMVISRALRAFLSTVVFFICFYYTKSLSAALLSTCASSMLLFFVYDRGNLNLKFLSYFENVELAAFIDSLKRLFLLSLPLAVTAFLISFTNSIPRLMLEDVAGVDVLGAFSSFLFYVAAAQIVVQSLCQVYSPILARAYIYKDKVKFRLKSFQLLSLVFLFSTLFVLLSLFLKKYIFMLIFNEDFVNYSDAYDYVVMISPVIFFVVVFGNINTAKRNIKYQPYIFMLVMVFTFLMSFYLINSFLLLGAVLSVFLLNFLSLLLIIIYLKFC